MPSEADLLAERLEAFRNRVINFIRRLPTDPASQDIAYQLGRAGPGIGSNHRSARRARSRAEFISRLAVALDEADESEYWAVGDSRERYRLRRRARVAARREPRASRHLFRLGRHGSAKI